MIKAVTNNEAKKAVYPRFDANYTLVNYTNEMILQDFAHIIM